MMDLKQNINIMRKLKIQKGKKWKLKMKNINIQSEKIH